MDGKKLEKDSMNEKKLEKDDMDRNRLEDDRMDNDRPAPNGLEGNNLENFRIDKSNLGKERLEGHSIGSIDSINSTDGPNLDRDKQEIDRMEGDKPAPDNMGGKILEKRNPGRNKPNKNKLKKNGMDRNGSGQGCRKNTRVETQTKGNTKGNVKNSAKQANKNAKGSIKETFKNGNTDAKEAAKEYAIEVSNLKIRYKCLNKVSIRQSLFSLKKSEVEVYEAVRGVSFKVPKGEIMGIVGKNGSGKSTMLRAIAGIFSPDEGTIDLHGYTVSLLSIGVGFQKKLSGRENIYLSGMLLGFTEKQVTEKLDDIIEFSGLGSFIDKPVRTYSSGMHSKLAFSITAILETEIMLIDEVLSVGDARFKAKSYAKMKELITNEDRTVIIVSHSTETLEKLCDTILWLHEGKIKMQGSTADVLPLYNDYMSEE